MLNSVNHAQVMPCVQNVTQGFILSRLIRHALVVRLIIVLNVKVKITAVTVNWDITYRFHLKNVSFALLKPVINVLRYQEFKNANCVLPGII